MDFDPIVILSVALDSSVAPA
ncbi:histone1a [Zea mays]|uniref:Histone1a n=1 Tax=Zea mays TaxID=4577 RepID=A0A1D6HU95_MAIZE|nr:histone1a [Zea mays]ONM51879.1 histone1a [Zea mays]